MACKDKKSHRVEIFTKTTFGQGESSTDIWATCPDCGKSSNVRHQMGFPATEAQMRMAHAELNDK